MVSHCLCLQCDFTNDGGDSPGPSTLPVHDKFSPGFLKRTLLIFAMKLRHKLTYSAAEDMMKLAGVLTGEVIPKATKYFWKQTIGCFSEGLSTHHVCGDSKCRSYIGLPHNSGDSDDSENEGESNQKYLICPTCQKKVTEKESLENGNFFIYHSLGQQIKHIIEVIGEKCDHKETRKKSNIHAFEDIYDGDLYKKLVAPGMLSVNFSVDGVPIFESGANIYPLVCTLNELEPKKRREHIMLCGLWYGMKLDVHSMSSYLTPFVKESQDLFVNGIKVNVNGSIQVKKVKVLSGVSDSVQRPVLRCSKQFNGRYGCGLCLHKGIQVVQGKGTTRVYPLKDKRGKLFEAPLRSHEGTEKHAELKKFGIRGRSILCDIPGFNIISCLDLDWAHAVLFGVTRQFTKLMILSSLRKRPFSLYKNIKKVDEYLKAIKPSLEVSRTPRKLSACGDWKMHEWVIWLLFYSLPALNKFIKDKKYVRHWALLVEGISILCKRSIMKSEVEHARRCLHSFVQDVPELYGLNHVSFNVHLLTHLADSVLNLSCLWTHSSFIYEDCYQELLSYINSSNGVPVQMRDCFRMRSVLKQLLNICKDDLNEREEEFLESLISHKIRSRPSDSADGAFLLGTAKPSALNDNEYFALQRIHIEVARNEHLYHYERAIINKEVFQTSSYSRVSKRNSYVVLLKSEEVFEIHSFVVLQQDGRKRCFALGYYFNRTSQSLINGFKLSHLIVLKGCQPNQAAVNVNQILEKVTYFKISQELSLACVHPNHTELLT